MFDSERALRLHLKCVIYTKLNLKRIDRYKPHRNHNTGRAHDRCIKQKQKAQAKLSSLSSAVSSAPVLPHPFSSMITQTLLNQIEWTQLHAYDQLTPAAPFDHAFDQCSNPPWLSFSHDDKGRNGQFNPLASQPHPLFILSHPPIESSTAVVNHVQHQPPPRMHPSTPQ